MNTLLQLEEAQAQILKLIQPLGRESVPLSKAASRIAAEDVVAQIDLPPFDNSAMDGFAIKAEDIAATTAHRPISLRVIGSVAAGQSCSKEVTAGTCIRVFTGSPLPKGADAVVMQEDTRTDREAPGIVSFLEPSKPWEHIRFRGEDIKQGGVILKSGERLTAARLSLLAAAGQKDVSVSRCPVVSLIATGDELKEPGELLAPGQIYESNRISLQTLAAQIGAVPKAFPLVRDDPQATESAFRQALDAGDVLVTSGGVSVGDFDFVKKSFEQLGGRVAFWKVAIKPGKPFVFGQWQSKFFFGLPGNPISSIVTFLLLVRPALLALQGARALQLPRHPGVLAEALINRGDRRHFMRVHVDAMRNVRSSGTQASHILQSLADANGLVDVPPNTTLEQGRNVSVLRWEFD